MLISLWGTLKIVGAVLLLALMVLIFVLNVIDAIAGICGFIRFYWLMLTNQLSLRKMRDED
jgi:hypothetical protein